MSKLDDVMPSERVGAPGYQQPHAGDEYDRMFPSWEHRMPWLDKVRARNGGPLHPRGTWLPHIENTKSPFARMMRGLARVLRGLGLIAAFVVLVVIGVALVHSFPLFVSGACLVTAVLTLAYWIGGQ